MSAGFDYRCHDCQVAWRGTVTCWACGGRGEPLAPYSLTNPSGPNPEARNRRLVL